MVCQEAHFPSFRADGMFPLNQAKQHVKWSRHTETRHGSGMQYFGVEQEAEVSADRHDQALLPDNQCLHW